MTPQQGLTPHRWRRSNFEFLFTAEYLAAIARETGREKEKPGRNGDRKEKTS
jgi:hypothetical protein